MEVVKPLKGLCLELASLLVHSFGQSMFEREVDNGERNCWQPSLEAITVH